MSLQLSDTANLKGILQLIEKELEFDYGYITDNATRLKEWVAEVNLTHDDVLAFIFRLGGTWQFDDNNHTDYPEIEADLISGQRDYTFTSDETGNLILDIHRVLVKGTDGVYRDLTPVDKQTPDNYNSQTIEYVDGQDVTGTPNSYDKTANGILLNPIPNYSWRIGTEGEKGIKILINREGSYFLTTDASKKPGIAGLFHEIYVYGPASKYAGRKGLASYSYLDGKRQSLMFGIEEHYGRRERDKEPILVPLVEDNR